jgi:TctA family transporter
MALAGRGGAALATAAIGSFIADFGNGRLTLSALSSSNLLCALDRQNTLH